MKIAKTITYWSKYTILHLATEIRIICCSRTELHSADFPTVDALFSADVGDAKWLCSSRSDTPMPSWIRLKRNHVLERNTEIYSNNWCQFQLMYVPPNGSVPANQDTADAPVKKILLWNGAASWSGIRPGRGVFIKRKCPVSTCVISTNRWTFYRINLYNIQHTLNILGSNHPNNKRSRSTYS